MSKYPPLGLLPILTLLGINFFLQNLSVLLLGETLASVLSIYRVSDIRD